MRKRILLNWERNQDSTTRNYHVYRSARGEVTKRDTLVMVVEQPSEVTPISVSNERLVRLAEGLYKTAHGRLISITVTVDGQPTVGSADMERGAVAISPPPSPEAYVLGNYVFDGVSVFDDDRSQTNVTYYGPVAMDWEKPVPPDRVYLAPDPDHNQAILTWVAPQIPGVIYDYRIEAVGDKGQASRLSLRTSAKLVDSYAPAPFIIEAERNGQWSHVTEVANQQYDVSNVDSSLPGGVRYLNVTASIQQNSGSGDVAMQWLVPLQAAGTASPRYRIRTKTDFGEVSAPSQPVGPVMVSSPPVSSIVVRRKVADGSYPTLNGDDAVTIAALAPDATGYMDLALPDQTTYAVAIYSIDEAGKYSVPALFDIQLGDASAPEPVVIVNVRQHEF